jgi:hypothetical protein
MKRFVSWHGASSSCLFVIGAISDVVVEDSLWRVVFSLDRKRKRTQCNTMLLDPPTIQSLSLSHVFFFFFFFYSCLPSPYFARHNKQTSLCSSSMTAARRMYSQKTIDSINNKPVWLSDVGAYPVIIICTVACVGAFSYIGYKTTTDDIQISANKRGSVIRWWGHAQSHKELVASLK